MTGREQGARPGDGQAGPEAGVIRFDRADPPVIAPVARFEMLDDGSIAAGVVSPGSGPSGRPEAIDPPGGVALFALLGTDGDAPAPVVAVDGLGAHRSTRDAPVARFADLGGAVAASAGAPVADLAVGARQAGSPTAGTRTDGSRKRRGTAGHSRGVSGRPGPDPEGGVGHPTRPDSGSARSEDQAERADPRPTDRDDGSGGSGGDAPEPSGRGFGAQRRPARSGGRSTRSQGRSGGFGRSGPRGAPAQVDPDADPIAAAREICLRLLADRARTRQELAQALHRKGVPDEAAGEVLERFDEVGLIDDAAFAGQWVRSRHSSRGLARRAIAMELRRKGVDDEVAGEALAEVDDESEQRRARELVDRKLRSLTVDTTDQRATAARRLVGMLARKGYGGGIGYRVVREALAAHGAAADELGAEPPLD